MTLKVEESTKSRHLSRPKMSDVAVVILGGGRGKRLFPLTETRCKPAISFGGRYRLIDVPVSNALNSGCNKIFILTQFLSSSIHRHILQTYQLNSLSSGFIDVLAAEQKPSCEVWYQGTADALRQNITSFRDIPCEYFLVLSGDQIYDIDFREIAEEAKKSDADLTVATLPVSRDEASRMGVMQVGADGHIERFYEKPKDPKILDQFKTPILSSMGIYLYKREALLNQLSTSEGIDFGMHLIPEMVTQGRAHAFVYDGYWEDIGTIGSFYRANIDLAKSAAQYNLFKDTARLFAETNHLPGARVENCLVKSSLICEGSIVDAKEVSSSILGPRSLIGQGAVIKSSYVMGNDSYAPPVEDSPMFPRQFGIGEGCLIEGAIIDKHVSIGKGATLVNKGRYETYDSEDGSFYVRDGVLVVTKGATIPENFEF